MTGNVIDLPEGFVAHDVRSLKRELADRLARGEGISEDELTKFALMTILEEAAAQWAFRGLVRVELVAGVKHYAVTPLGMRTEAWDPPAADNSTTRLRRELARFLKETSR